MNDIQFIRVHVWSDVVYLPALMEIADRLGFADQSHFTCNYNRIVGIPPGAFRTGLAT